MWHTEPLKFSRRGFELIIGDAVPSGFWGFGQQPIDPDFEPERRESRVTAESIGCYDLGARLVGEVETVGR